MYQFHCYIIFYCLNISLFIYLLFLLDILVHLIWCIFLFGTCSGERFWAIDIWGSASRDTVIHIFKVGVNSLHFHHQQQMRVLLALHPYQYSVLNSSWFYLHWWIVIAVLMWIFLKAHEHMLIGLLPFWNPVLWLDCTSLLPIFTVVGYLY